MAGRTLVANVARIHAFVKTATFTIVPIIMSVVSRRRTESSIKKKPTFAITSALALEAVETGPHAMLSSLQLTHFLILEKKIKRNS
jgi:hypothetical protein